MTMELLAGALVLIAGFYAWVTFRIMRANEHTVAAIRDQAEAVTRPYVVVTVFSVPNSAMFYLRIANTGRTAASDVRLTLDRDFYQYGRANRRNLREAPVFQQAIDQLPPGAELTFALAQSFVIFGDRADPSNTPPVFTVLASYAYGDKTVSEKTTIDLRPYRESIDPPSAVASELKKVREQLEKIAKGS